jgi:hypothetical protein
MTVSVELLVTLNAAPSEPIGGINAEGVRHGVGQPTADPCEFVDQRLPILVRPEADARRLAPGDGRSGRGLLANVVAQAILIRADRDVAEQAVRRIISTGRPDRVLPLLKASRLRVRPPRAISTNPSIAAGSANQSF